MITFLLGGMWHGAGWTFIFWGFLHGSALVIYRIYKNMGYTMNSILAWFITFNFINITWIFFRATNWNDAIKILEGMFFGAFSTKDFHGDIYWQVLVMILFVTYMKNSNELKLNFKPTFLNLSFICTIIYFSLEKLNSYSEFLYFNF
jgi:D-alanyl-lipoteichoic acid acyltransferase DltB (MBOAT superfamily)